MNWLKIYRIFSYILLPVGGLLGLATVMGLLFALGNIAMLFSVFLTGATVIYIYSSFVFLKKGIEKQLPLRHSLKDLIKVNAYVALFFSLLGLMQGVLILFNPEASKALLDNMVEMQNNNPKEADLEMFQKVLKTVLYFMVAVSTILLIHINSTFKYLKQHSDLFLKQ